MRRLTTVCTLTALLAAGSAEVEAQNAQPVPLTLVATQAERVISGRSTDIIGVHLGMTFEQVSALVGRDVGGKPFLDNNLFSPQISRDGVVVATVPFRAYVEWRKGQEEGVKLFMGAPTTGNRAVIFWHGIAFPDEKTQQPPDYYQKVLTEKYGEPSGVEVVNQPAKVVKLYWAFDGNKQIKCPATGSCSIGVTVNSIAFTASGTSFAEQDIKAGVHFVIRAVISTREYPNKTEALEVNMVDNDAVLETVTTAAKQLTDAMNAQLQQRGPVQPQAPRL